MNQIIGIVNTRRSFQTELFQQSFCVYCGGTATTRDHVPPRCFLKPPLPSNLLTLPACAKCNNGFSFEENVVRTFLSTITSHSAFAAEKQLGGWLEKSVQRHHKIRQILEESRVETGKFSITPGLLSAFERVFFKTMQGMFFGLYKRIVPTNELQIIRIEDRRAVSPDQVIADLRPNPFQDISDEPFGEITPNSWHTREPIFIMECRGEEGSAPERRVFRLVRDTPVEWTEFQKGIFRFAFVKCDAGGSACVFEVWETLLVTVRAPWPDGRGPLRRGRKNPWSRD